MSEELKQFEKILNQEFEHAKPTIFFDVHYGVYPKANQSSICYTDTENRAKLIAHALNQRNALSKENEELLCNAQQREDAYRSLIACPCCGGAGGGLSANLGVFECPQCGGDGHCIPDKEGYTIEDLLEEKIKLLSKRKEG